MMYLNLKSNNPNQEIDFDFNGTFYKLHIFTFKDFTLADVMINGEFIIQGMICIANQNIIQEQSKTPLGNFRFVCVDNEYPFYTKFNKTQQLVFYPIEELNNLDN